MVWVSVCTNMNAMTSPTHRVCFHRLWSRVLFRGSVLRRRACVCRGGSNIVTAEARLPGDRNDLYHSGLPSQEVGATGKRKRVTLTNEGLLGRAPLADVTLIQGREAAAIKTGWF